MPGLRARDYRVLNVSAGQIFEQKDLPASFDWIEVTAGASDVQLKLNNSPSVITVKADTTKEIPILVHRLESVSGDCTVIGYIM